MIKLKNLITEKIGSSHGGGGATRISGKGWQNRGGTGAPRDMDQTNKDWMKKSTDDWWDGKSSEEQAAYIKAHPGTSRKVTAKKSGGDDGDTKKGVNVFDPEKTADEPSDMDTEKPSDEPEDDRYDPADDPFQHGPGGGDGFQGYTSSDNWGKEKGYGQKGHKSYDSSHIERDRQARQQDTQAVKQELEKAPPEAKSWYEKKIGAKVDKALTYAEDVADWWESAGYEEDEKNPFPKWGETETRSTETVEINGKQYRPIKESNPRIFKEIYDRTFRSLK